MGYNFKNRETKLYILRDPRDLDKIRYVGITVFTLNNRLRRHLSQDIKHSPNSYRSRWLNQLLKLELKPIIELVKVCKNWEEACTAEILLIEELKKEGHPLTNTTVGGDGKLGVKRTKEQIDFFKSIKPNLGNKYGKSFHSKSVYQYSSNGDFIKKWECMKEASHSLGVVDAFVSGVVGKDRTCKGFRFKSSYLGDKIESLKPNSLEKQCVPFYQYDLEGNFVKFWKSYIEIEKQFPNIKRKNLHNCATHNKTKIVFRKSYKSYWFYTDKGNKIKIT